MNVNKFLETFGYFVVPKGFNSDFLWYQNYIPFKKMKGDLTTMTKNGREFVLYTSSRLENKSLKKHKNFLNGSYIVVLSEKKMDMDAVLTILNKFGIFPKGLLVLTTNLVKIEENPENTEYNSQVDTDMKLFNTWAENPDNIGKSENQLANLVDLVDEGLRNNNQAIINFVNSDDITDLSSIIENDTLLEAEVPDELVGRVLGKMQSLVEQVFRTSADSEYRLRVMKWFSEKLIKLCHKNPDDPMCPGIYIEDSKFNVPIVLHLC